MHTTTNGDLFLVMEYLPLGSLKEVLMNDQSIDTTDMIEMYYFFWHKYSMFKVQASCCWNDPFGTMQNYSQVSYKED
jgi:hypothetical protein